MLNVFNFHLTNACNYNCTYCFGKFPDKRELTLERACTVVDNIYRYFLRNKITDGRINLVGGEPLLYPYLDELIDYINAYGIKVSVITNGSLLTESRIALWKDKVYCIGLSIDSALTDTNVSIGRCCNHKALPIKQAVRITQSIHRNGIKLKINTVVSKFNVNEDMKEIYKRLKPDRLKLMQVAIVDEVNCDAKKFSISKKEFNEFCKRHKKYCFDTVCESSDNLVNSYLMINPQGEVQLNNLGKYEIYGNCLEEEFCDILNRVPIDEGKFNARYGKEFKAEATTKKICIFGGHDTWIKAIKERLLDAKFFRSGDLHSLDVIRNADEVWIQPNAISHSFYGKVLDAARTNNVTVCYFSYASARKCAEQIMLKNSII